jgi:hypothetical protein
MTTVIDLKGVAKKVQTLWVDDSLPGDPWSWRRAMSATHAALEITVPPLPAFETKLVMGRQLGWPECPEEVIAKMWAIAPGVVLFYPALVYTGGDAILYCPPHQYAGLVRRLEPKAPTGRLYDVAVFGEMDRWKARICCYHAFSKDMERVPDAFVRFTMENTVVVMNKAQWNELDDWLKKWLPADSNGAEFAHDQQGH